MNELDARLTRRYVTKVILYILLSVLLYVLTTARGTVVSARLVNINVMPFFVAALGFFEGPYLAGSMGVWCGLLLTLSSNTVEGAEALALGLFGVLCGTVGVTFLRRIALSGLACGLGFLALRGVMSAVYYQLFYGIHPRDLAVSCALCAALSVLPGLLSWQLVSLIHDRLTEEES